LLALTRGVYARAAMAGVCVCVPCPRNTCVCVCVCVCVCILRMRGRDDRRKQISVFPSLFWKRDTSHYWFQKVRCPVGKESCQFGKET
jgi:hypothetical protein